MAVINLAVISDLHCTHSLNDVDKTSKLHTDDFGLSEKRHPIKALFRLIEEQKLHANLLLCPGDIANKADKQGLITGWSYLEKVKSKLSATDIVATIGNHDIESRNSELGNIFSEIKYLDENYPIPGINLDGNFWANGFSLVELLDVLVLNLNTCYFHGNAATANKSKVETYQLEAIEGVLKSKKLNEFAFKIVLCHHHPISHSNIDYEDSDTLDKGDEFIKLAHRYGFQIVIHGHKHEPRLTSVNSMPVFCAGSFSSRMNVSDLEGYNTFHIITLEEKARKGFIKSWVHLPQEGWVTKYDTQFPCYTGFGFSGDLQELAGEINSWINSKPQYISRFPELTENFKDLNYLNKDNQIDLSEILKRQFNLEFIPSFPNRPNIISKLVQ